VLAHGEHEGCASLLDRDLASPVASDRRQCAGAGCDVPGLGWRLNSGPVSGDLLAGAREAPDSRRARVHPVTTRDHRLTRRSSISNALGWSATGLPSRNSTRRDASSTNGPNSKTGLSPVFIEVLRFS